MIILYIFFPLFLTSIDHKSNIEEGLNVEIDSNAKIIDLKNKKIKKLPNKLKTCSEVKILDLEENRLTNECFDIIMELKQLKRLTLVDNMINKIPYTFCYMNDLSFLDLGYNCFKKIPKSFKTMNIKFLKLDGISRNSRDKEISYSEKIDILKIVFSMKNLITLSFRNNRTGNIEMDLNINNNVRNLDLRNNNISEVPSFILNFKRLKYIDLTNNKIMTIIPLNSLKELKHVRIEDNIISNILPGTFHSLEELRISLAPETSFPLLNINKKQALKTLKVVKTEILPEFAQEIFKVHTIQSLTLSSCEYGNMMKGIEQMTDLQKLEIYWKNEKIFSSTFSCLENLQSLSIFSLKPYYDIKPSFYDNLKNITTLKNLEIDLQSSSYLRIPPIFNIIGLERLIIAGYKIDDLKDFLKLKNLKYLEIRKIKITTITKEDIINLYKIDTTYLLLISNEKIEGNIKEEIRKRRETDGLKEKNKMVVIISKY
ncbi:Leucine rich repeat protein [Spraguea lophii 42_110]|uniref:Leucine rich repeat protein n=1 Tax=Spraguea lophii (strain 42_110) TaxID=1358809 RepID=S7XIE7_SPRLO|nr:Leucine rich repeat protein [Spraguea lophii 42_110]